MCVGIDRAFISLGFLCMLIWMIRIKSVMSFELLLYSAIPFRNSLLFIIAVIPIILTSWTKGFYSSKPWCWQSGVRLIHFFSSLILIFHQYSVSKIHFYHTILQDSIRRHPGLERLNALAELAVNLYPINHKNMIRFWRNYGEQLRSQWL